MSKCRRCGKAGVFLALSPKGYCEQCVVDMRAERVATKTNSAPANSEKTNSQYEYVEIPVAGVTHNVGKTSRQSILRKIKFLDPPFDHGVYIELRQVEFEGENAVEIWINNEHHIGYVPKEMVKDVLVYFEKPGVKLTNIEVVGGGKDADGESLSYGARIYMRYDNQ